MAIAEAPAVAAQCERTTKKLSQTYGWRLDSMTDFSEDVAQRLITDSDRRRVDSKAVERACLTEYFARIYDSLTSNSDAAREEAARQLFDTTPDVEGPVEVVARGYLVKAALRSVGSWRRKYSLKLSEDRVRELAMDAASTALASVSSNIASCRGRDLFWGWATRIVENSVVDEMRTLRRERAGPLDEKLSTPDPAAKVVDDMAIGHEFVRKCKIGELSPEQRVTLYKFFWEDASVPEIAKAITDQKGKAVTAGNVSVWKNRGLRIMAKNLHSVGFR